MHHTEREACLQVDATPSLNQLIVTSDRRLFDEFIKTMRFNSTFEF